METAADRQPGAPPDLPHELAAKLGPRAAVRGTHPRMNPDLWSMAEVARYLGLCETTVYRLARRGELPGAMVFARRWRVSKAVFLRAVHGDADDDLGQST